ncbi:ribosome recycling factor [Humidesulfovibrio mexicanus]|uniref:Ribosome-recycling factor n=1 Tax=Humidesulfovibrio mexicanus TaxID=147047 RepID=A0A238YEH4_9BACT|nr:ribosome recycling factor [Humidesulfovibrio mexicanus]SNR69178.1 ribosome recycling factor [Humidesulfovibrio mexicanus]
MHAVIEDGKKRMSGALTSLTKELARLRTGRASVSLIEPLMAEYYGNPTPVGQIASLSTPDARTITIQPWDKQAFGAVEKAILKSDLGLNPVNDGKLIRITIPPLTEERRKDLVKLAKKFTEEAKVAARNVRRDLNEALKKLLKDKDITEDEERKLTAEVQKLTDETIKKCDDTFSAKEKEILAL